MESDLVMFGKNLPHVVVTTEYLSQIVIQMDEDFLGDSFLHKPELREIRNLFSFALRGIEFGEPTKQKASNSIAQILNTNRMNQLVQLLSLMNILSEAKDMTPICSEEYALNVNVSHFSRLRLVYEHIENNFKNEVSIKKVAEKLNLSEAGFYKFIEKQTKKSYTQIINEFRINIACRLLIETEKNISEISYACGFNNQSYFNRKFKDLMRMTPYDFKSRYDGDSKNKIQMNKVTEKLIS